MGDVTLKFNRSSSNVRTQSSYSKKTYSTGTIYYTTKNELPERFPSSALIFTTDTAELYVGTDLGIQKLKLGSEEDLDPKIFLTIARARELYQTIDNAKNDKNSIEQQIAAVEDNTYSKTAINDFILKDANFDGVLDNIQAYTKERIDQLLGGKAEAADIYTKQEANELLRAKADKAEYEATRDTVNAIAPVVSELQTDITTRAKAANVYSKDAVDATVADIDSKINKVKADLTQLSSVTAKTTDLNNAIETVNHTVEGLDISKATVSYVNEQDLVLDTNIKKVANDLETFATNVYNKTEVNSKIAEVNTAVTNTNNRITESVASITEDISAANRSIALNANSVTSNKRDIDKNTGDISDIKALINELQTTLSNKANTSDVYTTAQIQDLLAGKVDMAGIYRAIDEHTETTLKALFEREDELDLSLFYTKTDIDGFLALKANEQDRLSLLETVRGNSNDITRILEVKIPNVTRDLDQVITDVNNIRLTATDSLTVANDSRELANDAKISAKAASDNADFAIAKANQAMEKSATAETSATAAFERAAAAEENVTGAIQAAETIRELAAGMQLSFARLQNETVSKTTFETEMLKKADLSALDFKVSTQAFEEALALKADKGDLEALEFAAAVKTDVDEALAAKADKVTVDNKLDIINNSISGISNSVTALDLRLTAALADTSYVDNAIRNKANAADVYTKAEVDELLNDVVRQVLNTLTLKILGQ